VHDLFGEAAPFAQLGSALADLLMERFERGVVLVERSHLLGRHDRGRQVALGCAVLEGSGALFALEQQLDATETALDLSDPRDDSHRVEDLWRGLVGVVALRDGEDQPVAFERGFDCPQSARPAGGDGCREPRENDRPAEGQDRESLAFSHGAYL
jgi:hypothetical protein